ncbi:MAG: xanthine dehydrogenase family protein [Deltaproteobacteria bacterium]|nr:xanthine dehydrogenase family protein [Deltaproteobacteria bacterium]
MIGDNKRRKDAHDKMDGSLRYTADVDYPGLWHAATVRAPLAHGRLRGIRQGGNIDWSKLIFATAADIPGTKNVRMIAQDMPFLADDLVRYKGEPVAVVAAPTRAEAQMACRAVEVEMEPLEAILTLDEIVAKHQRGDPDLEVLSQWSFGHGDVEAALESADIVVEGAYTTPHQEQAYLETNAMTAIPEDDGGVCVEGSLQCPYYVAPAVAAMLDVGLDKLHVRALPMGGAFGGKEDFPSVLGGHVALLAQKAGRPVRIVLDRSEDIAYSTKRHPAWMHIRTGAAKDGTLIAADIDIVFDGGAYATMSPVVLSRGAIHAPGPYRWPVVQVRAVAYRTHTPPNGAFRGFGVPQTAYAIESHMDRLAQVCEVEPHTFRLNNRLRIGDRTGTSQVLKDSVASEEVLKHTMEVTDFARKWRKWGIKGTDKHDLGAPARGVGLSFFWHGAGFTGAGEARIAARVALDLVQGGRVRIRVSSTEMGQGAHTVLPQIVANALGVPHSQVSVDPVDTRFVPDSGPTVASRTTMIVGGELEGCALDARAWLLQSTADKLQRAPETLSVVEGRLRGGKEDLGSFATHLQAALGDNELKTFERQHALAPHLQWDEASHTGDAYATYTWGCCVAEVLIHRDTYEVEVPRLTMVVDVGRIINPKLAKGQVEGGTLQALGYALCEEVGVGEDGALLRDSFQTYILPTTLDAPEIEVHMLEKPYTRGPGGAKGLGEMPMNGAAPALANAVEHALGVRVTDLPLSPEKIFAACSAARAGRSS